MTDFDMDTLLTEISPDAPCGEDISYDETFLDLERFAKGKAAAQVGEHVQEGEEPDWKEVYKLSLKLLERSRDLRVILYLTASALRLEGLSGFLSGLALLRGGIERYWDHLHPQLDPEDDNDPLERMNIIGSLSPPTTVMSDADPMKFLLQLMEVPLCMPEDARLPRSGLRHMLLASGERSASKADSGSVPSMQVIDAAFEQTDIEELKNTDHMLHGCLENIRAIDQLLVEHVGSAAAPNFGKLENLLKQMQSKTETYLQRRGHGPDVSLFKQTKSKIKTLLDPKGFKSGDTRVDTENQETVSGGNTVPGLSGHITSNQEVVKALDMILNYYEQNEVSSPIPLLIKRAKRLVGRSFVDIIRDISPDALSQVLIVSGEKDLPGE